MVITKDMYILTVLKEYPEAKQVLVDYGLGCSNCLGANSDRIEEAASSHEIDLESLLVDLNELVDNKEEREE